MRSGGYLINQMGGVLLPYICTSHHHSFKYFTLSFVSHTSVKLKLKKKRKESTLGEYIICASTN